MTRLQAALVDVVKEPHDPRWILAAAEMMRVDLVALADSYVDEPLRGSLRYNTRLGARITECADALHGIINSKPNA